MNRFIAKKLKDEQLENFDSEYVFNTRREAIFKLINRDFRDRKFIFLDIGGGNGSFTDRLLEQYPDSQGIVLDNSKLLLDKNKPHHRKKLILGSAGDISELVETKFDIIFLNFLLHHLVANSYKQTRANQQALLRMSKKLLSSNGRISIFENLYNGYLINNLPGKMIFHLTSSKFLEPIISRLGANTAGIGVCFLSRIEWEKCINKTGLNLLDFTQHENLIVSKPKSFVFNLKTAYSGHFWCESTT